jgi:hypothetical protein
VQALAAAVAGIFALAGLIRSPLVPSMLGFAPCILVLQLLAALAIVVHFRRVHDPRWWRTFAAPGIGALGLFGISTLAILNSR